MTIALKRIYEPIEEQDGFRVLVDRLWPRGIRKDAATIGLWLKDIASSTALRQWFKHDPKKWDEFKARYFAELDDNREYLQPLLAAIREGKVSLIYSSRDEQHNQAVALKEYLENLIH